MRLCVGLSRTKLFWNEIHLFELRLRGLRVVMIGRDYLARQAATLLRLALLTRDARQAASLAAKAAELKERLDAVPLTDVSPMAPDIDAHDQARRRDRGSP
jgi:hypothetical protein